ncbi:ParA family protein [Belnapia sp. T6]|uniref:ParA family protein n=1 Tax=Belnapia mucosa TaxID=2804532 RepID=A0ABS1VBB3_9PROT|nr:ParA family protein [Belnapia mucosa]MBL6458971.1 ParA family protein [Belnapia mucosa]
MKRLLFSAGKGGVGKTTLCRNLAAVAAHGGLRVVTADLDPQATLTIWSRRRPKTVPAIPHFKVAWSEADALLDDGELDGFDALFIDTPPSIETQPASFQALLGRADLVVVPTRATFDDAESVAPFLKHLREEERPAVAVLNFVKPRVNINAVKSFLLDAGELCPVEVADRTDYARAGAKGLGLIDVPGHAGSEEMQAVWSYVRGKVWGRGSVRPEATRKEKKRVPAA